MKTKLAALAAIATLAGTSAQAAEWWWVANADNGANYYIDRRVRTEVIGQRTVRMSWVAMHRLVPAQDNAAVENLFYQVDCSQRESALKASRSYTRNGEYLGGGTVPKVRYEPVTPETVGEAWMVFICNAERGAGKNEFTARGHTFYRVDDPAEDALKEWAAPEAP